MDGAKSSTLPQEAAEADKPIILFGSAWNALLDHLERITPRGDGSTVAVKVTPSGSIISKLGD